MRSPDPPFLPSTMSIIGIAFSTVSLSYPAYAVQGFMKSILAVLSRLLTIPAERRRSEISATIAIAFARIASWGACATNMVRSSCSSVAVIAWKAPIAWISVGFLGAGSKLVSQ